MKKTVLVPLIIIMISCMLYGCNNSKVNENHIDVAASKESEDVEKVNNNEKTEGGVEENDKNSPEVKEELEAYTELSVEEKTGDDNMSRVDWRRAYRQYFDDVFAGKIGIYPNGVKYGEYGEKQRIYMALQDITDDEIPELLIDSPSFDLAWQAYTATEDGYKDLGFGEEQIDFYDPVNKKLYTSCPYSLTYTIDVHQVYGGEIIESFYRIVEGSEYEWGAGNYMRYDYPDGVGEGYYTENSYLLSGDEAKTIWDEYNSGLERYAFSGVEITPENLDQYF